MGRKGGDAEKAGYPAADTAGRIQGGHPVLKRWPGAAGKKRKGEGLLRHSDASKKGGSGVGNHPPPVVAECMKIQEASSS